MKINQFGRNFPSRFFIVFALPLLFALTNASAALRVTGFSPASGPVGTSVTLTGEGFHLIASNNIVRINGQLAHVTAAGTNALTVTIPPGTTYGSFSVTANGLTAESKLGFVVTFPVRTLSPAAFGTPSIFSPGTYPAPTEIADLDGDGRPDLVEVNHFTIGIYRNDGTGNLAGLFTLALSVPSTPHLGDMRLTDMDGDGRLDIVAMNYSESAVSVFRNTTTNGLIAFAPRVNFPHVDVRPYFAVADLDGDGRPDIITPSFTGGYLRVLRNTAGPGTISFAPPVDLPTMANPSDIAVQDLDGDGKPEVAVLHHVGSITALEIMRNVTTPGVINSSSFPVTTTLNANGNYLAIADLDSDGRPDLVAGAIFTHNLTVFQNLSTNGNLGGSAFGPPVILPTAGVTKRIAVSDLDGDGRLDIVAATELSDSVGIFRNLGGANGIDASWFAPRFDLAAGWNADSVSISDLDLDGLPDILFTSIYDHEVWIYRGIQPPPPVPGIQITSVSPLSGPVGTSVTLAGEGFDPIASNNIVRISGVRAVVTAATETSLVVTIPAGAVHAPFVVTAHGLSAQSRLGFVVTFPTRALNASAFGTAQTFSPGEYPSPTAIGDLDGDGRPDLVTVNHFTIGLYRNDGTGSVAGIFSHVIDLPGAEIAGDIHLADLDGDGKLDIVVVSQSDNAATIYRNLSTQGNIAFAPRISFPVQSIPLNAAVADLDGDGRLDIIATSFEHGSIGVLRNTSDSNGISFAPRVDFPTMAGPHDVAVQDLDGDGKADLVVIHHIHSSIATVVLRNVSEPGSFGPASLQATAQLAGNGAFIAFGDINRDGKPDVVTCSGLNRSVTVFQNLSTPGNLGNSAFGPPVVLPSAGVTKRVGLTDLDGDGWLDIVFPTEISDSLGIYRNVGGTNGISASWFAPRLDLASGWNGDGLSLSDIDLDGFPDIVFCSLYDHEVWIYRGIQPPPPTPPVAIQITGIGPLSGPAGTAVTLTGGGFSPIAGSNIVFIGGLRATVTAATTSNLTFTVPPGATYGPITVTVNGSSVQSLLSFTTTFPPRTLDASAFDSPVTFSPGDGPIATRVADLDGDGRPDLAVAHHYANTVAVYANTGTGGVAGVFSPKVDYPTGENPFDLHLEDVNGDGKLEMIVMNYSSNTVSVFPNTSTPGNISFASRQDFPVSGHAHNGAIGDIDGDGKPDIAVAVYIEGKIAVLRNTSGPLGISFAPPVDFLDLPKAHDVGIQDLDGDGKADIVVTGHLPGAPSVTVLRNVSQPGIIDEDSLEFAAELDAEGTYVVFADFDGDGRQDIVTCSWFAHSVTLFQNLSTPGSLDSDSFGPPVTLPSAGSTKRIAVADLDGDGRVDLAFPTELGDSLGIYRNVGGTNEIDASWFAPRVDLASGWNGDGVSIGDIDLDGLPDIIFCSFYIDEVWIYRGIRLTTPEIVNQPASVTIALGASASLTVQATGGGLHYSWYHDGELLPNATGATLAFPNAHGSDTGSYFVIVSNSGGAVTSAVVTVTVTVDRTLALGAVADVDEGGLVSTPLTLASSGEVGGIDFVINYNATYLAIPEIIWDDSLNNALKEFSVSKRGELRGVIALPATGIPAGTQTLATVQFRARTVNGTNAHVSLNLHLTDMSDALGDPIVGGTEVLGADFDIHDTGFLTGDNNANHQLDVGDAALLMRLLAQLDSTRAWDVPANDFNLNDRLDSGDVIKILRAIAGIDAPPAGAAPSGRTKSLSSEIASLSPAQLQGSAGQLVTVQVRLDSLNTPIAGASFTLSYPVEALRLRNAQGHRVGIAVPGGTLAVWNVAPGQTDYATQNGSITLALSGSSAWMASNTVLAEFTFEVQPAAANRYLWPIRIEALEVTGNGFNNRTLGPITSAFVGRGPVSGTMTGMSVARPGDVSFNLSGDPGANYRVDFSEDLIHWTLLREILDHTGTIQIVDPGAGSRPQRFYRSVPLP